MSIRIEKDRLIFLDQGPGIPEDVVSRIGQPFNRGPVDCPGFGLGLAWVKTVCEKYGWHLQVEGKSSQGGAKIEIRFPPETTI